MSGAENEAGIETEKVENEAPAEDPFQVLGLGCALSFYLAGVYIFHKNLIISPTPFLQDYNFSPKYRTLYGLGENIFFFSTCLNSSPY